MPKPTFVAKYASAIGTGATKTITGVVVQAGDRIHVYARTFDNSGADTLAANPSGGTFTWASPQSIMISGYCSSKVWTSTAGSAQTFDLSVTTSASGHVWSFTVEVHRDSDGFGLSGKANATGAPAPLTLNGVSLNSAVWQGNADWNATAGARTPVTTSAAFVEDAYHTGSQYVSYDGRYADMGAAGNKSIGWTAPTGQKYAFIVLEILGRSDEQVSVTDSATGADSLSVTDRATVTDSATGSDTVTVSDAAAVLVTDTATGTDTVSTADFTTEAISVVDSATGTEVLVVDDATTVADSGLGTDALTFEEPFTLTDSGTGTDTASVQDTHFVTVVDSGTGTEDISVRDVPFTAALPLRAGVVYDLVVVARIPNPSGPPMLVEIDPIPFETLSYTNTLSRAQDLSATCLGTSLPESILQLLRAAPVETLLELHLTRGGRLVFAGPLYDYSQSDGEKITFHARGLLSYLRRMRFRADTTFTQVDQFAMVKAMIDQWQVVEWGHFGLDTSAVGESGMLRDGTYLRNDLNDVGQRVEELGARINGFDIEVDPATRRVQLWHPFKGVDRSAGEDAVVFDAQSLESSDIAYSVAPEDLASEAFGTSSGAGADETLFSARVNTELLSKIGRSSVSGTFSEVSVQATLDDHTQAMLDARSGPLIVPGPKARITADTDLETYAVGDTVYFEAPGPLGVAGAFRLRTQTVSVGESGEETISIEFM